MPLGATPTYLDPGGASRALLTVDWGLPWLIAAAAAVNELTSTAGVGRPRKALGAAGGCR